MAGKSTQLYVQVFEDIWNKITMGYYKTGDQLPTEGDMAEFYKMSRAPIKQALGKLENAGLITRQAGKGTFVTNIQPRSMPIEAMGGFGSQYIDNWKNLSGKTLTIREETMALELAKKLNRSPDDSVTYVERLRLEKNDPIFYLNHYILWPIDTEKLKACGDFISIRSLFNEQFGFKDYYAAEEVSIALANQTVAERLKLQEKTPVMYIKRFSYDVEYKPFCYSEYYVNPAKWTYKIGYCRKNNSDGVKD